MYPKTFSLPFFKKEQIAKDTYSFFFDRKNSSYDFLPGQYNRITLSTPDGRNISRDFTIASSPLDKEYLMITIKSGISDFKKTLFSLQPGELVIFSGPMGGFVLRDTDIYPHVFLASGIGITPFHSMIMYAAAKKLTIPITLIASFSTLGERVFYDELSKIAALNSYIKIVYTVTHFDESHRWHGETGRISESLIRKHVTDIYQPTYYIVGSQKMVDDTEELLEKMGIEEGKIKIEMFEGY